MRDRAERFSEEDEDRCWVKGEEKRGGESVEEGRSREGEGRGGGGRRRQELYNEALG